jgi:hypothetical protein
LDSITLFRSTNQHNQIQLLAYCLPYIRLPKTPNHYRFTLKMATAMSAETMDNFQHSTQLIPESRSCTEENVICEYAEEEEMVLYIKTMCKLEPFRHFEILETSLKPRHVQKLVRP